ncbi:hypothetical protein F383_35880 [Gossypium arboreum]|uniref:Uncharacterized protein n=1 Tax=Gossypium arboreum TaxID=29729 RepID=A0A0B0PWG5_GOSAR|nr:hypothetical protein F383_35880 [Gossypium arboreum]
MRTGWGRGVQGLWRYGSIAQLLLRRRREG